ncbi:hypothetical protein AB0D57_46985 [Streptomyces sp. NPDC048275]|uniref:hypothetical protein n=1 Tax=Streptomyces sp. NPDC048275 TaxID=3155629 RepID=UPI003410AD31
MPTLRVDAHRQLTALRTVVQCKAKATALREGPAAGDGPGTAWVAFLCPVHCEGLPEWPATQTHAGQHSMPCGTVLDFRPTEQVLQSHADLWLTPLTGVRPETYGGVWSDVRDQAERVLSEHLEQDGDADEDGPCGSMNPTTVIVCLVGSGRRARSSSESGSMRPSDRATPRPTSE